MPSDINLLNKRKQALLTELESIKGLLNTTDPDSIPLLEDTVLEDEYESLVEDSAIAEPSIELPIEPESPIELLEELPIDEPTPPLSDELPPPPTIKHGALPGQQSLFKAPADSNRVPAKAGSKASLAQNPFLPPHVRERFERAIEDDNPNNNSATDLSTTTPATKPIPAVMPTAIPTEAVIDNDYAERLVDQLVAHHLPQIETELRKRLSTIAQQQSDNIKK